MYNRGPANEGAEKADHEIDGVIRRKNAQVAKAGLEGIQRSKRHALLEIIFVGHDAAFGAPTSSGGVDDRGGINARPRHEHRGRLGAKILPWQGSGEIGIWRSLSHQHSVQICGFCTSVGGSELPPNRKLGDQGGSAAVLQQLPMLGGSELVVEWNEYATGEKDGIRGNQPLRLIGHDNCSAIARLERGVLQGSREWMRSFLEITIGEPVFFSLTIGFDQADFVGEFVQCILQGGANGLVIREIEHYRRDWMREARVRKSLTPWTS